MERDAHPSQIFFLISRRSSDRLKRYPILHIRREFLSSTISSAGVNTGFRPTEVDNSGTHPVSLSSRVFLEQVLAAAFRLMVPERTPCTAAAVASGSI